VGCSWTMCVRGTPHQGKRSLMRSSWVLQGQPCKGNHALQHLFVASYVFLAYSVHRDTLTAHTCLALDASQHHKKQDSTVVVTPRTPRWHSLQVKMLLKTCLHVVFSFAHHMAKMHAGLLNLSAVHVHFFVFLSRPSAT